MEQWKAAFKQIFGKTPTKTECSIAPSSVRGTLLISPEKQPNCPLKNNRKRKQLFLKPNEAKDEEFCSPVKKLRRPKMASNSFSSFEASIDGPLAMAPVESIPSSSTNLQQLLRPPTIDPFLSPVKNWTGFLTSPSRSAQKGFSPRSPSFLLKTPSPAKLLRRPIMFTNIGNLLTPEKATKTSLEEEEEEENGSEGSGEEMEEGEDGAENDEEMAKKEEEKPKKAKRKPAKSKKEKANYVSLNLRRRQFAPISKFRGKNKRRWNGKNGGGTRRGLFGAGR